MPREVWTWLIVLIGIGVVKAHIHLIKLLMLALGGLGALYLVHKLAQDFNKIQNSWGMGNRPLLGGIGSLFKRSTNEVTIDLIFQQTVMLFY